MNLQYLIGELSQIRPVFRSESDFQDQLARLIQERYPESIIRLEYTPSSTDRRMRLDLMVESKMDNSRVAIELKYITQALTADFENINYDLKNHGAPDLGRHDFLKDVMRLEEVVSSGEATEGHAIIITNDKLFWEKPNRTGQADEAFRIHEGRDITGVLEGVTVRVRVLEKVGMNPFESMVDI